jgi:hypothetical protein
VSHAVRFAAFPLRVAAPALCRVSARLRGEFGMPAAILGPPLDDLRWRATCTSGPSSPAPGQFVIDQLPEANARLHGLGARAADAAKRRFHQAAAHFAYTLVEAPLREMFQDEHA